MLAGLRQLSLLIRKTELNGSRDPRMAARRAELQRDIREHDWKASGLGEAAAQASLSEVGAALEDSEQTLVAIVALSGEMVAVVVRRGAARLVQLGDFGAAAEAARRLNADLDTLAGRRLPTRLEAVIRESIRHQAQVLTAEMIAPLRSSLGDGGIVVVPADPLASIPLGRAARPARPPGHRGPDRVLLAGRLAPWACRGGAVARATAAGGGTVPGARGPGSHRDRQVLSGLPPAAPGHRHRGRHVARPRRRVTRPPGRARAP